MKILRGTIALAAMALLVACQPATSAQPGIDSNTALVPASETATEAPLLPNTPTGTAAMVVPGGTIQEETPVISMGTPLPPNQESMVRLTQEHLSKRLNIPIDQVTLFQITAVTWHDASLGCPKPGIDYLTVETPGYNIVLEAGGQTYVYHTDQTSRFVQCASRSPSDIFMTP